MLGVAGPTVSDDKVGFTKKPRQLTAKANVTKAAKLPIRRTLLIEGIISLRLLKRTAPGASAFSAFWDTKIVAEAIGDSAFWITSAANFLPTEPQ